MLKQVYIDKDVLTATKERISMIFDDYENIVVSISGGRTARFCLRLPRRINATGASGYSSLMKKWYTTVLSSGSIHDEPFPDNTIPLWFQIEFHLTNATSLIESQLICWEAGKHKIWMRPKIVSNSTQAMAEKETVRDKTKVLVSMTHWKISKTLGIILRFNWFARSRKP